MLMPCKNRPADKCSGNSMDGVCRMNYNKVPARCEEGDLMDREDICASLQADACKSQKGCCWSMAESLMGQCIAVEMEGGFEMELEDCPASMPRIFPIGGTDSGTSDTGSADAGATDAPTGDASASGDASTDAPTASSGDAVVSDNSGSA